MKQHLMYTTSHLLRTAAALKTGDNVTRKKDVEAAHLEMMPNNNNLRDGRRRYTAVEKHAKSAE